MNSILLFKQKTRIRRVHNPAEKVDLFITEKIHIKPPHITYSQEDRLLWLQERNSSTERK